MGETIPTWKPTCNSSVSVQLSSRQTSSDSGALLLREVLDHSGVIEQLEDQLVDSRDPARVKHSLAGQLRTLLIQPAQGWDDLSDTDTLRADPVLKLACSDQRSTTPLGQSRPSQPTLSRALNLLTEDANLPILHESLLELATWRLATMHNGRLPKTLTLDVDGLPIEVFGQQTGTEWSKYLGYRHYSPLVASIAETGDMVGGLLRRGNVGNAAEADHWIPHLVRRLKSTTGSQVRVRFDAGFTGDRTLRALEEENIQYVGRITGNSALQRLAEPYLRRPPGRPPFEPREWCHELYYKATGWKEPRKIILVVREVPGELFLRYFFLVTNLCWKSYPRGQDILRLYRQRGKAEGHMGELKSTLNVHLSSTCRGASTVQQVMARNQINLLLSLYSYQLMHALRCLLERQTSTGWSIRRLREQVLKTAATVAVHARRITVHLSQSADKWWPALLAALPRLNLADQQ